MRKYIREYRVSIITPQNELITIETPLSFEMQCERSTEAKMNSGTMTFYNLAEKTRNAIYKDRYNTLEKWAIQVVAGYKGGDFFEIFAGNIIEAFSIKEGTEWITKIEAYDGAWAIQNGDISETISSGGTEGDIFSRCIQSLPGLLTGVLGENTEKSERGEVLVGNPWDILAEKTGGAVFIDGGVVNILRDGEIIGGQFFTIDQELLLETPRKRDTFLEAKTIFSPELRVGYSVIIKSKEERFNGRYKILGLQHSASFSSASCGEAITTLSLDYSGVYKEILR